MVDKLLERALEQGPLCVALLVASYLLIRGLVHVTKLFISSLQAGQTALISELKAERSYSAEIMQARIDDLRTTTNRHEIHIQDCNTERVQLRDEISMLKTENAKMQGEIALMQQARK